MRDFDWVFVLMVDESDERVEDGDVLLSPVKKVRPFCGCEYLFFAFVKKCSF